MAPSIPAKMQKSKRPAKNPAGPPCRFFSFLYVFNFFLVVGGTKCSSSCVMTPSPHSCRNSPEVYFKTGKTPHFPHTFPLKRPFLAGGVITKIRQVTHGCLVGDFSTRLRLARNDKDMTHTLRTPIGSSGEEGEIWMAWPPSAS